MFVRMLDWFAGAIYRALTASAGSRLGDLILGLGCTVYALYLMALVVTEGARITEIWIPSWPTPYNRGWMPQWIELVMFFLLGMIVAVRAYSSIKALRKPKRAMRMQQATKSGRSR